MLIYSLNTVMSLSHLKLISHFLITCGTIITFLDGHRRLFAICFFFFLSSQFHLHWVFHVLWLHRTICNSLTATAKLTLPWNWTCFYFLHPKCPCGAQSSSWTPAYHTNFSSSLKAFLVSMLPLPFVLSSTFLSEVSFFLCRNTYCAYLRKQRNSLKQMLQFLVCPYALKWCYQTYGCSNENQSTQPPLQYVWPCDWVLFQMLCVQNGVCNFWDMLFKVKDMPFPYPFCPPIHWLEHGYSKLFF